MRTRAFKAFSGLLAIFLATTLKITSVCAQQDSFANTILGSWGGAGTLFGAQAEFEMTWEWVLDGKFLRLTFQNQMATEGGKRVLQAEAFYRPKDDGTYTGSWFDSRGVVLPLKATLEDNALVTLWGSEETEQGKTIYRPVGEDSVAVEDFVLKNGAWSKFGEASYSRRGRALSVVRRQQEAFNAHDAAAIAGQVAEDVTWFSVTGDSVIAQTSGRADLHKAMEGYFKSIPSARSEVEDALVSGSYVAVRERAYWHSKGEERSQASLGVYEVRDGKILRVWYFPAQ